MKLILTMMLALLLSPFAADAAPNNHVTPKRAAKMATAKVEKANDGRNFFQKLLGLSKPKPAPAVVAAKPDTPRRATSTRGSSGQRSAQTASVAKVASAVTKARTEPKSPAKVAQPKAKPPVKPGPEIVRKAELVGPNVLARPKAEAPSLPKILRPEEFSKRTVLGRAWRATCEWVKEQADEPTKAEAKVVTARVTAFHREDGESRKGNSSTGKLRPATETQIGVAAGPAALVGSYVTMTLNGREYRYLVADTGSAVEERVADTRGVGLVIDVYTPKGQLWDSYQQVEIVKISGAGHYLLSSTKGERDQYLKTATYDRALELARRG